MPLGYLCFSAARGWRPLHVVECQAAFREMQADPDYTKQDRYSVDHEARIATWSRGICGILVARDDVQRPPPYDIHFSTGDVLVVVLDILQACLQRGYGGLAKVERGYFVSIGNLGPNTSSLSGV